MIDGYEMPWRTVYEAFAALAYLLCVMFCFWAYYQTELPKEPIYIVLFISVTMTYIWSIRALDIWKLKSNLVGRKIEFIVGGKLQKISRKVKHPASIWIGKGFIWKPIHVQRSFELSKRDLSLLDPPKLYSLLFNKKVSNKTGSQRGAGWIHGLEKSECDQYIKVDDLDLHTLILGTTGSGKTRLFELMIQQAINRVDENKQPEVVIVLDPKGDSVLRERMQVECQRANREDAFLYFHPAFPRYSIRIDPLKNWNRASEIASRVAALVPSEKGDDAFKSFAWRAIDLIAKGLIEVEERPTLVKLRRYIEGGSDQLLLQTLESFCNKNIENWEIRVKPYIEKYRNTARERNQNKASPELLGIVQWYKTEVKNEDKSEVIDGLISMFDHNKEHYVKMIATLLPVLQMVTSGELGKLLSPDTDDHDDPRPIMDTAKMINGRYVVYIGLDSLPDPTVGAAAGLLLLADFAAVAGSIYNFGTKKIPINLYIDEASEIVNDKMISLLNKGRGAKFRLVIASQTIADFESKTGSESKARMILGNTNNIFALRTRDEKTQSFITESMGTTQIKKIAHRQNTNAIGMDKDIFNTTGGYAESMEDENAVMVSTDILGKLPDLEYFCSAAGGEIVKGRIPIIKPESKRVSLEDLPWVN